MSEEEVVIAGRYRLVERIGSGGMGVVWRAYDERLRRTVAVKQVYVPADLNKPQGEEMVRRTMREGRIAARLHHPQLITVYDVVEDGGRPYLIMEYFPATSLKERGTMPYTEAARIGAEAAAALAAAHEAGVVHRDVKPANILLGEDGTVKITDFGISRVISDMTLTATSTFAGSPAYLAPEVAKGEQAGFASDVYSLGATLYTVVEGAPPVGHDANAMKLLYRVASGEIDPPTKAGPLTDVLMWLLSSDPKLRPSMTEAKDALAALHESPADAAALAAPAATTPAPPATEVASTPAAAPPDKPPHRRRRAAVLAAGLLAVAAVAALVTLLLTGQDTPKDKDRAAASTSSSSKPTTATSTTTTTTPTTTTTTTTTTPPPPTTTTAAQQPTSPADAIASYYALMPNNRDQAWPRLTPKFQEGKAGGRSGYDSFWSQFSSVTATGVTQTGENTVEVNLSYVRKNGGTESERHRYTLVNQNGTWLIDSVVEVGRG